VAFTVSLGPARTVPSVVGLAGDGESTISALIDGRDHERQQRDGAGGRGHQPEPGGHRECGAAECWRLSVERSGDHHAPAVDRVIFPKVGKARPRRPAQRAGRMLVAFAASDGPPAPNAQSLTIAGAGLTDARARAATQFGVAEI
jgi:hypothetical protein